MNKLCLRCKKKLYCYYRDSLLEAAEYCSLFVSNEAVVSKPEINANGIKIIQNFRVAIPSKIIQNGQATILFWGDGTKTIVKCSNDNKYNAEYGFLIAYFEKNSGMSKSQIQKYFKENLHKGVE